MSEEMTRGGFSSKLKIKRAEMGLTQSSLAKKAGLSVTTVNFIENGKIKPQLKTIVALATALGEDPSDWLN